jgi:sucrose phosphorylase
MLPVRDILSGDEKNKLSETVKERGGSVSGQKDPEADSAFGFDVDLCDALAGDKLDNEQWARKILAAQSIIMSLPGVPGLNIQNLIGACGKTGTEYDSVINDLRDPSSLSYMIFEGCKKMLEARAGYQAFHPFAGFRLLESGDAVFCIERISEETGEKIICIANVSGEKAEMKIPGKKMKDIISGKSVVTDSGKIRLGPYGVSWLGVFD